MIVVTIGGVVVGICILGWHLIEWYPGLGRLKEHPLDYAADLAPFAIAWVYGTLGILTTMGLIGLAFDTALWASNWLGDAALFIGVGEQPGQAASGAVQPLTGLGNAIMLIATVFMLAAIKYRKCGTTLKRGMWCGLCLGTSSGVAGLAAAPLAQGANLIGQYTLGAIT